MMEVTGLHSIIGRFKIHLVNLITHIFEEKIESWLMPFGDLLVESADTVSDYVKYRLIIFIYRFTVIFQFFGYIIYKGDSTSQRISFVFAVLFGIYRLQNLSFKALDKAKIAGIIDSILSIAINFFVNYGDTERYNIINLYTIAVLSFYPVSSKFKLLLITGLGIINTFVYSMRSKDSWRAALLLFAIYAFVICMGNAYIAITIKLSKKLVNTEKESEVKLQNNNMLVASISHDLKNPLNSILGCIDLLMSSKDLNIREKEYLSTASYSGKIMTYLIANILDTAKMAKGNFDINRAPMDISDVLSKVISIENELAKAKGLRLYKKILTPLPKFVYGDKMRLSQILINIMGNAIKFTSKGYTGFVLAWTNSSDEAKAREKFEKALIPSEEYFLVDEFEDFNPKDIEEFYSFEYEGFKYPPSERMKKYLKAKCGDIKISGVDLNAASYSSSSPMQSIKYKRSSLVQILQSRSRFSESKQTTEHDNSPTEDLIMGDSGLLTIDIIDTGIGIAEEEQAKLFQPFKQVKNSARIKHDGTGLGLWITKQLVYLMSGFIELKSIPNKGSRFTITLPFKIVTKRQTSKMVSLSGRIDSNKGEFSKNAWIDLRYSKTIALTGKNTILNKMSLLIVEDDEKHNDSLLSQVFHQLKTTNCQLDYCSYSESTEILKVNKYEVILIIASQCQGALLKLVHTLKQIIRETSSKRIPLCIAIGNFYTINN